VFDGGAFGNGRVAGSRAVVFPEHLFGGTIDRVAGTLEDSGMSEVTSATPRRSGRIFHKMRVKAQGREHSGKKFVEACETVVVNAHGGLLLMEHEVDNGEMLVLTNPITEEEQECRVVYLGEPGNKGQRVGIEFLTPAPRFWGVEFHEEPPANNVN
jgi:hypothetical protein